MSGLEDELLFRFGAGGFPLSIWCIILSQVSGQDIYNKSM